MNAEPDDDATPPSIPGTGDSPDREDPPRVPRTDEAGEAPADAPERVCRRCSTVTATHGEFCPHCGASYVRRRRIPRVLPARRRTRRIVLGLLALLLVAAVAVGVGLKVRADDRAEDRARAEQREQDDARRDRERRAAAAAQAAAAEEDAAAEVERLGLRMRRLTVRELRKSVTKDARDKHAEGLLEDRATSTSCENTDGNEDDLDETSAEYSCIAITDTDAEGRSSGYRFTARVDFEEGSYTWHLGE